MCIPGLSGGSGKSQRTAQIWAQQQAEQLKAEQNAEAEKQRRLLLEQEAKRKENVTADNRAIDSAFGSFNDDYFKKIRDNYVGVYTPQIDDQFGKSKDKLVAALAGRGILESSVGSQALADLQKSAADQRVKVGNDALEFANGVKTKVGDAKNNLYAQSASSSDPSAIARSATSEATSLAQQGALTPQQPLADIFGSFLTPFLAASTASQNSVQGGRKLLSGGSGLAPISGSSSSIVRN